MGSIDCNHYSAFKVLVITENDMCRLEVGLKTDEDKAAWTPSVVRIVLYDFASWNTTDDEDDVEPIIERLDRRML